MYDSFAQELEKVAKEGKDPALEALLRSQKAKDELGDIQASGAKGAYFKGIAIGAGIAAGKISALMMSPWVMASDARNAEVDRAMQKHYIATGLRERSGMAPKDAMNAADDIMSFMKAIPSALRDPGIRDTAMQFVGRVPEGDAARRASEAATREQLTAFHKLTGAPMDVLEEGWRRNPQISAAVENRTRDILSNVRTYGPSDLSPTAEEWDDALMTLQKRYRGKIGTTSNKEFLKLLGKQIRSVGKASLPIAVVGGVGGALAVKKKRETLAKLRRSR